MKQFYTVIQKDGTPLMFLGSICHYSQREAINKAVAFGGTTKRLSEEENRKENLKRNLETLRQAFTDVLDVCDAEQEFNDKYPFHKCFMELTHDVIEWVDSEVSQQ